MVASAIGGHKIAIVGGGRIAPTHVDAYQESFLGRAIAVSDVAPSSLATMLNRYPYLAAFRDTEHMLEEIRPSIVSICTWPQTHLELVQLAARYGVRGIMCEKPLALSMADVDEMLHIVKEAGIKLAGGHQYRFHPAFVAARSLIMSGKLGEVFHVEGAIKTSLANNGPHLFDTIRFLLDDRDALRVRCSCHRTSKVFDRGTPVEEGAVGRVDFSGGVTAKFATGTESDEFFQIKVSGARSELVVTPTRLVHAGKVMNFGDYQQSYRRRQFRGFLRWVDDKTRAYPADATQSAKSNELVLALYESARLDSEITLPLGNRGYVLEQLYPNLPQGDAQHSGVDELSLVSRNTRLAIDGGKREVKSWFSLKPHIDHNEWSKLGKVLLSGNLNSVSGSVVREFENAASKMYSCAGAVASTSGTASIHVALGVIGIEPGDEVITTPITDMGTIAPILWCNGIPVFADIDPLTGNLTAESVARCITSRTRAVVLVHLFGRGGPTQEIKRLLDQRGIVLIEDCSQAHLATVGGELVGTVGDFGCFSLQQAKQITCGDGGFTLVNNEEYLQRAKLFVDKGWNRRSGLRKHEFLGLNYRMSELQGAVALAQLEKLPRLIEARRSTATQLSLNIRNVQGVSLPLDSEQDSPSWWIFNLSINGDVMGLSPDIFAQLLQVEGVQARRNYLPRPIFEEDVIQEQITYGKSRFPYSISDVPPPETANMPGLVEFMQRQIVIPWSSRVADKHVSQITSAVKKVAEFGHTHSDQKSECLTEYEGTVAAQSCTAGD